MQRSTTCPKCEGSMSEGVMIGMANGVRSISRWLKGRPAKSFWMGLNLRGETVQTQTYRCDRCGFLESYAPL